MTAVDTATRVLVWAAGDAVRHRPPFGPLWSLDTLAARDPDPDLVAVLQDLVAVTSARLGAGTPPFGDNGPIGPGALFLAAALGGRSEPFADAVASIAPRLNLSRGAWADSVARHAVVSALLQGPTVDPVPGGPEGRLRETLLALSPLTMVLHHPVPRAQATARDAVIRMLARTHGPAVLTAALAVPSTDPLVLTWRALVLDLLYEHNPGTMLDVYLTAFLLHGEAWRAQISEVGYDVAGYDEPSDLSIATLQFWLPLANAHRDDQVLRGLAPVIDAAVRRGRWAYEERPGVGSRKFLDPEEYGPVVRLVEAYRSVLTGGHR